MCRAVRVTIHQRQQIVINKAQLKARGRTDGQVGTAGRRWIYFSADAKAVCESLSLAGAEHDARANDSRNELLLINVAHWRNAHNTNHRL